MRVGKPAIRCGRNLGKAFCGEIFADTQDLETVDDPTAEDERIRSGCRGDTIGLAVVQERVRLADEKLFRRAPED